MLTKIQHDGGAYRDTGNKTSPFHTATSPCDDFALSQCLFMSHIFPNVCLMKYHNRHGVYFPAVLCGLCCHPKTQRDICHGVHDNSLVLRSVFSDSPKSRFQHMVPIQEGLLCSRFYPHFILGIGC